MLRILKLLISMTFCGAVVTRDALLCLVGIRRNGVRMGIFYHGVSREQRAAFGRQMDRLVRWARPVRADAAGPLPPGSRQVIITFDDGLESIRENALPELAARSIPSAIFVPTEYLGKRAGWPSYESNGSSREAVLSADDIRKLHSDLVSIGSHGITHRDLIGLEPAAAAEEIEGSRRILEEILEQTVTLFSFPYGSYSAALMKQVRQAGYQRAFLITPRLATEEQPLAVGRIEVSPSDWPIEFRLKATGMYCWLPWAFAVKRAFKRAAARVVGSAPQPARAAAAPAPAGDETLGDGDSRIDLSVVIVNWNTKDLLLACIASLLDETRDSRMEIIVVDNASEDGSAGAVQERFPQVRVICNSQNLGFACANNIGIRTSAGRYVCLVNSDTVALDGCLDRMRRYMDEHPEIGALGPKTFDGNRRASRNCREFPSLRNVFCEALLLDKLLPGLRLTRGRLLDDFDYEETRSVEVLSGCFLMIRRSTLQTVGLLDEGFFIYGEDTDWCKRTAANGWRRVFFAGAQAIHYGGASSSRKPLRFIIEMRKAQLQYWRKHHGRAAVAGYITIMIVHHTIRTAAWTALYLAGKVLGREPAAPAEAGTRLDKVRANAAQLDWFCFNRGRREVFRGADQ